jgi:peroxiredoxin Q/BCP
LGAEVLGVSGDTVAQLQKFRDKYELNFPLAGDTSHKMLEAYGVWQKSNLYGKTSHRIVRATYIIGSDGQVKYVFPLVKVYGHIQEVLAALRKTR